MTQNVFSGSTGDVGLLNANFSQLFELRELVRTPSYTPVTTRLAIDSSGRLLVGGLTATDLDSEILQVAATSAANVLGAYRYQNDSAGPRFVLHKARGAALGSMTAVANADLIGSIYFKGADGAAYQTGATIDAQIAATPSSDMPTRLRFQTTPVGSTTPAERFAIGPAGTVTPGADNTQSMGSASLRWSVVYAGTGTINTSDARDKTAVQPMSPQEIAAARLLAREIGTYKFLAAIAEKGDAARRHVGMTVQRAMEIMSGAGLDPLAYGFICHDEWPEETVPAVVEQQPTDFFDATGARVTMPVVVQEATTRPAGDRYAFRTDELLLFIARGHEARLQALEDAAA